MAKDLISIIIPIYNKERYVEQCLNSIKNQVYKNEILSPIHYDRTMLGSTTCELSEYRPFRASSANLPFLLIPHVLEIK